MFNRILANGAGVRVILTIGLAAAVVPAALCVSELVKIRHLVASSQAAVQLAAQSRDLHDRVSQSLFNLAAAPLDLSSDERRAIYQQTDDNLAALQREVTSAKGLTAAYLNPAQEHELTEAVAAFAHSWEEVKDELDDGMSEGEKTYHFLNIFEQAGEARNILTALEATAAGRADNTSARTMTTASDIIWLFAVIFTISGVISTLALIASFRTAASLKKSNEALKQRDAALREQNAFFNEALENMSQGLTFYDAEGRLLVANSRVRDIYRLPEVLTAPNTPFSDIIAHHIASGVVFDGAPEEISTKLHRELLSGDFATIVGTSDGRVLEIIGRPLSSRGGWVSTHEDITERTKAEARIAYLANNDSLTDLPNRVRFREELEAVVRALASEEEAYVLCLDLDHFKDVNDTLGHPVGDQLLKAVAERLRSVLGPRDIVARLGGDEFAVIQRGANILESSRLAERIVTECDVPFDIEGHQIVVGMSVGIARAPIDSSDPDTLLKSADMALYRAKTEGRGNFQYFEVEMSARMQERRELELDLRKAYANNELEVFYQPLVNLESNRISGMEALLRWRHPERGLVSPAVFIPLAEETGLIGRIGAWVLRQACFDALAWPEETRVAVNLSPVQFRSPSLVLDVTSALSASGLSPRRLELEITESVMLQDTDAVLSTLHQLRAHGVRISMDDFGTGYSSLSYLRKFPFDKIKIDQSFVRDLSEKRDSLAIIKAVASMSVSLGIDTVVEGVETLDQLELLKGEGCTEVQGYLFSRPKPVAEIAVLFGVFPGSVAA